MKLGIVLDNKVNKWALQRFEPLKDTIDITIFVGENNDYDISSIDLKKRHLTHAEEVSLALGDIKTAYKRIIKIPYKKTDFYYFSLKKHLAGIDVVYSCDVTRSAYTLASLKDRLGFKLLLSWWENIPYRAFLDDKTNFQKRLVMEKIDMFLPFTETAKAEFSIFELAEIIIKMTASKSKIVFKPLPNDDPRQRQPDIALAKEKLDWHPLTDLNKGLMKTIDYFKGMTSC